MARKSADMKAALKAASQTGAKDRFDDAAASIVAQGDRPALVQVPVDQISPNPYQPRMEIAEDEPLQELAASIKKHGILQPIRVRRFEDGYQLVAGERRWRASQLAGLTTIPAVLVAIDDEAMRVEALIENLQREDLNDMERARALRELRNALNITWNEVAERIGFHRSTVMRIVGLMTLPEQIQEQIASGQLSEKHGRVLRKIKDDPQKQLDLADMAIHNELTAQETAKLVKKRDAEPPAREVFDSGDPKIVLTAADRAAQALIDSVTYFRQSLDEAELPPDRMNAEDLEQELRAAELAIKRVLRRLSEGTLSKRGTKPASIRAKVV